MGTRLHHRQRVTKILFAFPTYIKSKQSLTTNLIIVKHIVYREVH